jgi:exosortase
MASAPRPLAATTIQFDRPTQIRTVIVGLAFVAVFYNLLLNLQYTWLHSADWSHGPLIPLFSIYLVYLHWDRVKRAPVRYTWVGLLLMLAGLVGYQWFVWGMPVTYARAVMMLVCLLGVIGFLCGLPIVRYIWVPWLYLFFAVPLPKGVYFSLTDPLRRMAAVVATHLLSLFPNLDIQKVGSTIEYVYKGQAGGLDVADACSGMRSTMTLCALGVAVAFISDRPWWQRVIMIGSCVPIAVFANFIRVTITSILHIFVDPKYATGTYHAVLGLTILLVAFGVFSALGWLLNNLFVEEAEAETAEDQDG